MRRVAIGRVLRRRQPRRFSVEEARRLRVHARKRLPEHRAHGGHELRGGRVSSFGDHRIAMALTVAGLAGTGVIVLEEGASVAISFPSFYSLVRDLTEPATIQL